MYKNIYYIYIEVQAFTHLLCWWLLNIKFYFMYRVLNPRLPLGWRQDAFRPLIGLFQMTFITLVVHIPHSYFIYIVVVKEGRLPELAIVKHRWTGLPSLLRVEVVGIRGLPCTQIHHKVGREMTTASCCQWYSKAYDSKLRPCGVNDRRMWIQKFSWLFLWVALAVHLVWWSLL